MRVVLLRVGIDRACGDLQSPLFPDGTFEFLPIPEDKKTYPNVKGSTYGEETGNKGLPFSDYFPTKRRECMANTVMHLDPEFKTFTYGDPTTQKSGLKKLAKGDILLFYSSMSKWDANNGWNEDLALYLVGYFEIETSETAKKLGDSSVRDKFAHNHHVRHLEIYNKEKYDEKKPLLLIKGNSQSRLFKKAFKIGESYLRKGCQFKHQYLLPGLRSTFGPIGETDSLQRSTPKWIDEEYTQKVMDKIKSLE